MLVFDEVERPSLNPESVWRVHTGNPNGHIIHSWSGRWVVSQLP